MCYSTYINKSLRDLAKDYDTDIDWGAFILLYRQRLQALKAEEAVKPYSAIKIPEGMDKQLLECGGPGAAEIQDLRWQFFVVTMEQLKANRTKILRGLQDLHELQAKKHTQGRADKIGIEERKLVKIDANYEKASKEADAVKTGGSSIEHDGYRVYPGVFAPIVMQRGNKRVIVPARFEILPASGVDIKHDLYNARRDSLYPEDKLKPMWKPLFGQTHAIISFTRFFESVELPSGDSTEIVVRPKGFERMHAACLFAEFEHEDYGIFRSFAICTDDPPSEIEAAGHDRCPIFIAYDAVPEWLNPAGQTPAELDALFDRKEPVTYEWEFMDPALELKRKR